MARNDTKARFGALQRLERRIEMSMREDEAPGFEQNCHGSFDRADLRAKLLQGYEVLVGSETGDAYASDYARYLFAGALMRARRYEDASANYRVVVDAIPAARLMLAMVEQERGDLESAQRWLDAYNANCDPVLRSSLEKIALRREG